jgi:hypothetical protein
VDCFDAGLLCYQGILGNQCLPVDAGIPCALPDAGS